VREADPTRALVAATAVADTGPAGSGSGAPVGGLEAQPVTAYASAPKAWLYRPVMRAFFLNRTHELGWQLRPADVQARLRRQFDLRIDDDELQAALDSLEAWGALTADADFSDAEDVREFRRVKRVYDLTPKAEEFEKALERIDHLVRQAGSLQGTRLPTIRDTLRRLVDELGGQEPDRVRLRSGLQALKEETTELREGATDFMAELGRLLSGGEAIDEEQFARFKIGLLEHLQDFQRALKTCSEAIIEAIGGIDRLGAPRMCGLVADLDPAPPLHVDGADQRAIKLELRLREWHGARSWFVGDGAQAAFWSVLDAKVTDAILAVISIAERLQSRLGRPHDRSAAWETLARRLQHATDEAEAHAWFAGATGLVAPRHFSAREADPDAVVNPGSTPWAAAPAAPVAAHLRRPGGRRPGAGAPPRLQDTGEIAARVAERQAREREQLAAVRARFCVGGALRLSLLAALSSAEFEHLMAWIGRAFEQPADALRVRRALSDDGRLEIALRPPQDGARTMIATADGRLDCPDYGLEVREL
jgi:uncharacterized protein (TIGR02677 family)